MKTIVIKYPGRLLVVVAGLAIVLGSCTSKPKSDDEDTSKVDAQTPVTVTAVDANAMSDYTDLNATSVFLQKNYVKSNANGYITKASAQQGQPVSEGQVLFEVKTKEAQAIGNSITVLDTTFRFSGVNRIKASKHGYISQVNHQLGDYVQDGEALATISDRSSFVFIMQLPYELRRYVNPGESIELTLPGGQKVESSVASFMPSVDTVAQTQGVVLRISSDQQIPENLVAKARIVKSQKKSTQSLPKEAVLANEIQTDFWVMKLINDKTAVKVPVTKGIETGDRIEILSPKFLPSDKIIVTGNYGLPDTAKVKIVQK